LRFRGFGEAGKWAFIIFLIFLSLEREEIAVYGLFGSTRAINPEIAGFPEPE